MAAPETAGPASPRVPPSRGPRSVADLRARLRDGDRGLAQRFLAGEDATVITAARAALVDEVLVRLWERAGFGADCALLAVGGYGRGELFPHSDVDLLVLVPDGADAGRDERIAAFVASVWDLGVEPAFAVRDLHQCTLAANDLQTATALLEARPLAGAAGAAEALARALSPGRVWPAPAFLAAKREEQARRHARVDDSTQRLEPDVKSGPGGLRDLHTLAWIAARLHGAADLSALESEGIVTPSERSELERIRRHLTRVRYALHLTAGRREDRLLFDLQVRLARQFGHRDAPGSLAVEAFMQDYYRAAGDLRDLNATLLGVLAAGAAANNPATPLAGDPRFVVEGRTLDLADPELFARQPAAMFELMLAWQRHPDLEDIGPTARRALRRHRDLIDGRFRADPAHRALFMRLLREPLGVTHALRMLAQCGVLGRYLPAFGAVAGRMQFDLFHIWTVDDHTLFVVSNLRRFALARYDHEFPQCSRLMQALPQPELVLLAGLFHDIAKGRGGDHSTLGAGEAREFCLAHGLDAAAAATVAWLVEDHLLLSTTAQKRDLGDPAVIAAFADRVGDPVRLDMLYLLTVADVRATNPRLWNSWKARLFAELRERTRALLRARAGVAEPEPDAREVRTTLLAGLPPGIDPERLRLAWDALDEEYFLRHSRHELLWHAEALAGADAGDSVVRVGSPSGAADASVLLVARDATLAFGRTASVLERLGLTVLDARLRSLNAGRALLTLVVLEQDGRAVSPERHTAIAAALRHALQPGRGRGSPGRRRLPRQARLFSTPTRVTYGVDPQDQRTVLELVAADRPGLLSEVAAVLESAGLSLSAAKVTTVGERAEDVFFITDREGRALRDPEARTSLARRLVEALDRSR